MFRKVTLMSTIACSLAACGGSTTTDSGVSYDYTQGPSSSEAAAEQAMPIRAMSSTQYLTPNGTAYSSLSLANQTLNSGQDTVATSDTSARTAWRSGWTGKNVKVGIPDDFNASSRIDIHGDWVALVSQSIAPEANYHKIDMIGSETDMTADQALKYFEDNGYHIINGSWGIDRFDPQKSGAEYTDFDAHVGRLVEEFDQNAENAKKALIIYAAGNSGSYCSGKRSERCSLQQAVIDSLRKEGKTAGESTIFVGSLDDNSNSMADYSIVAGNLKNDFIVAHDDVLASGDASGTSFAAPRVTGAAALVRHKFPNLTSPQLKQVLLQTATDLGDPGVDDVYGYGKLNIEGALSPIGKVVPK